MSEGVVFFRGPSVLTGALITGIVTGLDGSSLNAKTGAMAQAWILRADMRPMDAKRKNLDDAVCGDCKLRGDHGVGSICYVPTWFGPANVFKADRRGRYPVRRPEDVARRLRARTIRLGAYGDPAAIPFPVWEALLEGAAGWIGYTHQWQTCDRRFRRILMASVDSVEEWSLAWASGWRTFRIRAKGDPLIAGYEFVCPASDEAGHRVTCQECQLCRGAASPARNVVINAHGHHGAMVNFYRTRPELPSPVNRGGWFGRHDR